MNSPFRDAKYPSDFGILKTGSEKFFYLSHILFRKFSLAVSLPSIAGVVYKFVSFVLRSRFPINMMTIYAFADSTRMSSLMLRGWRWTTKAFTNIAVGQV